MKDRRRDLTNPGRKAPKTLHAGEAWDGQPYLCVTEDAAILSGQLGKGIITDDRFGTTIQGPLSLSEAPEYVSFGGGFWRVNPAVLSCIGSSAAMNIPWLVHDDPELLKGHQDIVDLSSGFGVFE